MEMKYATVFVKNMDESLEFYKNNFKLEVVDQLDLPDKTIMFLEGENGSGVELIKETGSEEGLFGLVFEAADVAKEVQILCEDNPDLEIHVEKTPNGNTLAFMKDPNGVNITLSQ